MRQEQDSRDIQAVLEEIKKDPTLATPSKEDLEKVISEREIADRKIKGKGRSLISGEIWQTA